MLLAVAAAATGFLLFQFYSQSASVHVRQAEETAERGCREIANRYAFLFAGARGDQVQTTSDAVRTELTKAVEAALVQTPGVEGGIWRASEGSLAYAFPTYEGTGPKTDVPTAELTAIKQVNGDTASSGTATTIRQPGNSQVLIIHSCPLGIVSDATAWTMTRVFTGQGRAYKRGSPSSR
jgi:hypothetical protein